MDSHFPVSLQQIHSQQQFSERLLEHLVYDGDVFDRWRLIGTAQCLATDIEIASFLIHHYENTWDKVEPVVYCVTCHSPLTLSCNKCGTTPATRQNLSDARQGNVGTTRQDSVSGTTSLDHTAASSLMEQPTSAKRHSGKKRQKGVKRRVSSKSPKSFSGSNENDDDLMGLYIQFAQVEGKSDFVDALAQTSKHSAVNPLVHAATSAVYGTGGCMHKGIKSFVCMQCGKIFFKSSDLKKHTRIHTREKPFACQICPAAFSDPSSFSRHKRVHTGEKPFSCSECHSAFAQSSDLTKHMRIHTRAKPLTCDRCDATFSDPSTAARHRRKHRQAEK